MDNSTNPRSIATAIILAPLLCLVAPLRAVAFAQSSSELVDRIVAIVKDTVITQSEIQEELIRLRAQGAPVPQDPRVLEQFLIQILDQKVTEVLVVKDAAREGITVSEREVEEIVEQRLSQIRERFPTEIEFQEALERAGVTPAEFRITLTERARSELTTQRYMQLKASGLRPTPVSEDEIRERFEAQRQGLGPRPASINLRHVIVAPQPSEDALLRAKQNAEEILERARAGEDFAVLAAEYSEDLGSKANGGSLGWVRQGEVLPEFETALFSMSAGELSDIVLTSVGYHILKLERVRGAERQARHILFRPVMLAEDIEFTSQLAEDIAAAVRAGADIDSLFVLYGDPSEQPSLTDYPQDRLPPEYKAAIEGAAAGDIIGPFNLPAQGVPGGKWIVLIVDKISEAGEWTFEDLRETLRQQIQQERLIEQVVGSLRESTYIELRLDTSGVG